MKTSHTALAGAAVVVVGTAGARYFGAPFKLYFLGFLVIAFIVASIILRQEEKGLAEELKGLNKEDQEDILSHLDAEDQERVRRDMRK